MHLEHLAIYVLDLEGMRHFYERYFRATANTRYHNSNTSLMTYFLTFPEGNGRLELMSRPALEQGSSAPLRTGLIHLAFSLGSKDAVDALTEQLKQDGYLVVSAPRTTGDGYYESCIADPEGNLVELVA